MTQLRYLGWEGYADGQFASDLREATGLDMAGTNHLSDDAACAMVLAKPSSWDIVNINTPFVRDVLHPKGVIRSLEARFAAETKSLSGVFERFRAPAESPAGATIGIPQRCGPFNLVVNERSISADVARDEGFGLALISDFRGRFGVLGYEDFNVMHTAIAAGLDPFREFSAPAMAAFAAAARTIFEAAALVTTDHRLLNKALIEKEIDFYISGGSYTASCARLDGHREVRAITPSRGPISGKGGVAFVEINAIIDHPQLALAAADTFLDHILSDNGAVAASLAADACNPVVQMQRSSVFERFTPAHLDAMQWQDFEEDMSRCADYALIPDYDRLLAVLRGVLGARLGGRE
jgi:spermidine/putrescine transport system substrate-binding protein